MITTPPPCAVPPGIHKFVSEGTSRKYMLTGTGNRASRLTVSMHGRTGSSESQHKQGMFTENGGGITVYPQSLGTPPATLWKAMPDSKDVRYVASLTTCLQSRGCGSPATTQINGVSMGAMMTSRLACDAPNIARSWGMVAGVLPPYCRMGPDKIVTIVHGRTDTVVGWRGEMSPFLSNLINGAGVGIAKDAIALDWQRAKGCTPTVVKRRLDPATVVTLYNCKGMSSTMLIAHTGGHSWDPNPEYSKMSTTKLLLIR